ncbi:MAG TPA: hypothetical protein VFQ44_27510 [Streptosporangiaceae bacterium]|nr:hypothetical protein [Streptosporangiaceae bacterium]
MQQPTRVRQPFLAQPWRGGVTGWIIVFGALLAELIAGVVVNSMSMAIAAPVLIIPAATAVGSGVMQWLQVQRSDSGPAPWWHLTGIAAGLLTWQAWPTVPSALQTVSSPRDICTLIFTATPNCLARTTSALSANHLVFWVTGAVIVALIPLTRKSRIAAWSATPVALAGCQLSAHFLELLLLHYHLPGA